MESSDDELVLLKPGGSSLQFFGAPIPLQDIHVVNLMEKIQNLTVATTSQLSTLAIDEHPFSASELHRSTTLPNELILKTLTYLPWRDIVRCRHLCRWVRDEVDQSVKLQYLITLGPSAMEDGLADRSLTSADRLRLLNAQQQTWRTLTWHKFMALPAPFSAIYHLRFSDGMPQLCPITNMQSLYYLQLPSTEEAKDVVELEWLQMKLGFEITDFRKDVEQDLLVLVESVSDGCGIRFHFWRLSTNFPHPAASNSVFEPLCEPGDRYSNLFIAGSHLALLFLSPISTEGGRLLVYSWVTGHERAYVEAPPGVDISSFTFLSPHVFVVPSEATLDLYSFNPDSTIVPAPRLNSIVSFHFPLRCHPTVSFQCHSYPYPWTTLNHLQSNGIEISPLSPFRTDRKDAIVVFRSRRFGPKLCFVVHRSVLLSYLDEWDNSQGVRNVIWDDWGPRNTRWIEEGGQAVRTISQMHGHRLVILEPVGDDTARNFIIVRDFNPATVSKALTRSVASDLVTTPTTLARGKWFEVDIVSQLPYLEARTSTPFICSGAFLDDQRILLFQKVNGKLENFSVFFL